MTKERLAEIREDMETGGSAYDYFWELHDALEPLLKS